MPRIRKKIDKCSDSSCTDVCCTTIVAESNDSPQPSVNQSLGSNEASTSYNSSQPSVNQSIGSDEASTSYDSSQTSVNQSVGSDEASSSYDTSLKERLISSNEASTSYGTPYKKYGYCTRDDCTKFALYTNPGDSKLVYCRQHATKEMKNRGPKKCEDCNINEPIYGHEEAVPLYCKECGKKRPKSEKLKYTHYKMCEVCYKTQPIYGGEDGKARFCGPCAKLSPLMSEGKLWNVKHKQCEDCHKKRPIFGSDSGKARFCSECAAKRPKEENLKDVINKFCKDCNKVRPSYGIEKNKPIYCVECAEKRPKEENIKNVTSKVCEDCKKVTPTYGTVQGVGRFCAPCAKKRPAEEGVRNVLDKMCEMCGVVQPSYGLVFGVPKYCRKCASLHPDADKLDDVVNKRCLTPYCNTQAARKHLLGYCYRCFIHVFPDNPLIRNHKTKERAIADFVRESFPDKTIILDQRIQGGCSQRRPDILIDMGEYVLIIEIDENQHQKYDCTCENKRLMELFKDAGGRPLVMIRFNPDQYKNAKGVSVASCWGTTDGKGLCVVKNYKKAEWTKRLATLKETIELVVSQGAIKEIDVIHLYYDGFSA